MFNRFVRWILEKAHRYHKIREIRHYDLAYGALMMALGDDVEARHFKKFVYHSKRCEQIDELIYAMEES